MKIKSITEVEPKTVYAIHTSTHTFISDGLAHHNCYVCNVCNHGEQLEYYYAMKKLGYTEDEIDKMRQQKIVQKKYTADDYQEIIQRYKDKSNQLTSCVSLKPFSSELQSLVQLPHHYL